MIEIRGPLVFLVEQIGESSVEQWLDYRLHTRVTASKVKAAAGESVTVTAAVYDFTGEQQLVDNIVFDVNGVLQTVATVGGIARIGGVGVAGDETVIRTAMEDVRNGGVIIEWQ